MRFSKLFVRQACERFNEKALRRERKHPREWHTWGRCAHFSRMKMRTQTIRSGGARTGHRSVFWRTVPTRIAARLHWIRISVERNWRDHIYRILVGFNSSSMERRNADIFSALAYTVTEKLERTVKAKQVHKKIPFSWAQAFARNYHAFLKNKRERSSHPWRLSAELSARRLAECNDPWRNKARLAVSRLSNEFETEGYSE